MVKNGQNCQKWSKSPKMVKIAKNGQNGLKSSKMVPNGLKRGLEGPQTSSKLYSTKLSQCSVLQSFLTLFFFSLKNSVVQEKQYIWEHGSSVPNNIIRCSVQLSTVQYREQQSRSKHGCKARHRIFICLSYLYNDINIYVFIFSQ